MAKYKLDLSDEMLAELGARETVSGLLMQVAHLVERFPDLEEHAREMMAQVLTIGGVITETKREPKVLKSRRRSRVVRTTSVKGSAAKRKSNGGKQKSTSKPSAGKGWLMAFVEAEAPRFLNADPTMTKAEIARRLFNIAKAKGLDTTVGSLTQALYVMAKKKRR